SSFPCSTKHRTFSSSRNNSERASVPHQRHSKKQPTISGDGAEAAFTSMCQRIGCICWVSGDRPIFVPAPGHDEHPFCRYRTRRPNRCDQLCSRTKRLRDHRNTMGLLSHTGPLTLPGSLHPVANWWVIGACLALFTVEFFADKIPAFDLVWNALHTFVRVPLAALLAFGATSSLSPEMRLVSALAGAAIAFGAHGGKTAVRAVITPSPEPVSNIALSAGEDVLAVFLTWLATTHP